MLQKLNALLESVFDNSDINKLLAVFIGSLIFLWFFYSEIAPLLIGLVIAYILESLVQILRRYRISRTSAAAFMAVFMMLFALTIVFLLPLLLLQLRELADTLPKISSALFEWVKTANDFLPEGAHIEEDSISAWAGDAGKTILAQAPAAAGDVASFFLYLVLMPLLLFFLLKDKELLLERVRRYSPSTPIFGELWAGVDEQFGAYIRGKLIEGAIIGILSWAVFAGFGMNYAITLGVLVALSVLIPFVGVVVVTIPVAIVAYLQFGTGPEFFWIIGLYTLIQVIDGQILVPILFSEVVKLHPVSIFASIIFFGNWWGVWGVFFAIPLASLIKSIVSVINVHRGISDAADK